jgi:sn-glycerol 3-phosphate transport system permease protein
MVERAAPAARPAAATGRPAPFIEEKRPMGERFSAKKGRRRRDWPVAMLLLLPSAVLFGLWVFYPLGRTVWLGFYRQDPFGLNRTWVGFEQYREVLTSGDFRHSLWVSMLFVVFTVPASLVAGLALALLANQRLRGMRVFRLIFSSTVATSVAVASMLWLVLLHPSLGVFNHLLRSMGRDPVDFLNDPDTALLAISATTVWQNLGLVFVVMVAGLQSIPEELHEAARLDGHGSWSRLRNVTVPMLSPTIMFALVVLLINAFQAFAQVDLLTPGGGPLESTNVLVYSLYDTVHKTRDPGLAAAKAVVLFLIILVLSMAQFRFLERRVHYAD